jgi:hypothetical protein
MGNQYLDLADTGRQGHNRRPVAHCVTSARRNEWVIMRQISINGLRVYRVMIWARNQVRVVVSNYGSAKR